MVWNYSSSAAAAASCENIILGWDIELSTFLLSPSICLCLLYGPRFIIMHEQSHPHIVMIGYILVVGGLNRVTQVGGTLKNDEEGPSNLHRFFM